VMTSDELPSFTLFPISGRVRFWEHLIRNACLVQSCTTRRGYLMVWAAISWYSISPFMTFHGRIALKTVLIRCIPWSTRYFRITMPFSKMTMPPNSRSYNCLVTVWRAWRWTAASSVASIITIFEYHWITLVSFGHSSDELIPTWKNSKGT
jgi:hypothetical protein